MRHYSVYVSVLFSMSLAVAVNIEKLLYEYSLLCGPQLCSVVNQTIPDIHMFPQPCSQCDCSDSCFVHGNCCPDKFFSLNLQCFNTTILSYFNQDLNSVEEDSFVMRTMCPAEVDINLKDKCEGQKSFSDRIQYPPVTSKTTAISYKNIFCAQCHNETELLPWEFNSVCQLFADFNFISSNEDLLKTAEDRKCMFNSYSENPYVRGCNHVYSKNIIKSCNISGTWQSYDEDIEWACENYDNNYNNLIFSTFKNVFCLMCNPPLVTHQIIEKCNITGKWTGYDNELKEACTKHGKSLATYPFKNVYCYMCNMPPTYENTQKYFDARAFIIESITDNYFEFEFEINEFPEDYVFIQLNNQFNNISYVQTPSIIAHDRTLANIYEMYYAMTGNGHFCHNISTVIQADDSSLCSCHETCHFGSSYPCCLDAAFKFSTTCMGTKEMRHLVYDGCENAGPEFELISHKCKNMDYTDLLTFLPVIDRKTRAHYKNIYCGLCRYPLNITETGDIHSLSNVTNFQPWKFTVKCKTILPVKFTFLLADLFDSILKSECEISPKIDSCTPSCQKNMPSCENETSDNFWACHNFRAIPYHVNYYYNLNDSSLDDYSNVFCAMCKPVEKVGSLIDHCNITGKWDIYYEQVDIRCKQLPLVDYHWPYKNIFCKMCNEHTYQYEKNYTGIYTCYEDLFDGGVPSLHFRSLFSLSAYDDFSYDTGSEQCMANQNFDSIQEKCRDIVCYPGRLLVNGSCVPLLPRTSNLGYILTFGMDVSTNSSRNVHQELLLNLIIFPLKNELDKYIGNITVIHEEIIMKANRSCFSDEPGARVSVFLKIFVSEIVDREMIESHLIHFQSENLKLHVASNNDKTWDFLVQTVADTNSLYLPLTKHLHRFSNESCMITQQYQDSDAEQYIHSHVTDLLQCKQVELESSEFTLSKDGTRITVPDYDTILEYHEFYLSKSKHARICIDKFQTMLTVTPETSVVQIVLLICTIISLFALFLTFVTYCLFRPLRTLPGKNNMSLVVSMFLAFSFLEFGVDKTKYVSTCVVIGVFIHYFWLCAFCCLNVCSFHMYHAFHRTARHYAHDKNSERRRVIFYLLYSFGLPLLIVVLNLIINYSMSDNSTYGYGGKICFISVRLSTILAFIVPVIIICTANLFFYVTTAYTIATTPKVNNDDTNQHNRIHFIVYVKLFIITGCAWLIQIIDAFLPMSAFSIVVSLLNSFQGMYICLAYICNMRVFNMYRNYIRCITRSTFKSNISENTKTESHTKSSFKSSLSKRRGDTKLSESPRNRETNDTKRKTSIGHTPIQDENNVTCL